MECSAIIKIRVFRGINELMSFHRIFVFACFTLMILFPDLEIQAQGESNLQIRRVVTFEGKEREYFIQKPQNFDSKRPYWLLVVVHGGGGNGGAFWLLDGIRVAIKENGLDAIIVSPSFSNTDYQASRFPALGEGAFLKFVLGEVRSEFRFYKKILLTGYSRGGQFTHRFAFQNPQLVKACAPFSAGTWSTPNGKLLIESINEVVDPESFLNLEENATMVPDRLRGMFEPWVAKAASMHAKKSANKIPYLVMCGTLDPRFGIAKLFVNSLELNGFVVRSEWPQTPHGGIAKYPNEFKKYSKGAADFFLEVTRKK